MTKSLTGILAIAASGLMQNTGLAKNPDITTEVTEFNTNALVAQVQRLLALNNTNLTSILQKLPYFMTGITPIAINGINNNNVPASILNQADTVFSNPKIFVQVFQQAQDYVNKSYNFKKTIRQAETTKFTDLGFQYQNYNDVLTGGITNQFNIEYLPTLAKEFANLGTLFNTRQLSKLDDPGILIQNLISQGLGTIGNLESRAQATGIDLNNVDEFDKVQLNEILSSIQGNDIKNIISTTNFKPYRLSDISNLSKVLDVENIFSPDAIKAFTVYVPQGTQGLSGQGTVNYEIWSTHAANGSTSQYATHPTNTAEFDKFFDRSYTNSVRHAIGVAPVSLIMNFTTYTNLTSNGIAVPTNGEYYAVQVYGTFMASETGTYVFTGESDDSVDLFIDNTKVLSYYGGRGRPALGTTVGSIYLTAGVRYKFKARMQEYQGGDGLTLFWRRPSESGGYKWYQHEFEIGISGATGPSMESISQISIVGKATLNDLSRKLDNIGGSFETAQTLSTFYSSLNFKQFRKLNELTSIMPSNMVIGLQTAIGSGSGADGAVTVIDMLSSVAGIGYVDDLRVINGILRFLTAQDNTVIDLVTTLTAITDTTTDFSVLDQKINLVTGKNTLLGTFDQGNTAFINCAQRLKIELENLSMAGINPAILTANNDSIFAFVERLHTLGQTEINVGSRSLLEKLVTKNAYGEAIEAAILEGQNLNNFSSVGIDTKTKLG